MTLTTRASEAERIDRLSPTPTSIAVEPDQDRVQSPYPPIQPNETWPEAEPSCALPGDQWMSADAAIAVGPSYALPGDQWMSADAAIAVGPSYALPGDQWMSADSANAATGDNSNTDMVQDYGGHVLNNNMWNGAMNPSAGVSTMCGVQI